MRTDNNNGIDEAQSGDVTFADALSRRSFLLAAATAIAATGLSSVENQEMRAFADKVLRL